VQSGNSGGPLVEPDGEVAGVVFGAAADNPDTGFALTAQQVAGDMSRSAGQTAEVSTGQCTAG
jgi:S1-C subfamily serine protease